MALNTNTSIGQDSSFSAYKWSTKQNKEMLEKYKVSNEVSSNESDINSIASKQTFSREDLLKLKEIVAKKWEKYVTDLLKKNWTYEKFQEIAKNTIASRDNDITAKDIQDVSSTDETQKLIDENKPKDTLFPQYTPYTPSADEMKGIEESANSTYKEYYDKQRTNLWNQYNTDIRWIDRLIEYAKTDAVNNLAKINTTFAKTMTDANRAYGRRNILQSWIVRQDAGESVSSLNKDLYNREYYDKMQMEWLQDRKQNIKTTYEQWLEDISQNEQVTSYFNIIKDIEGRRSEYDRAYLQGQQNIDFWWANVSTWTDTYTDQEIQKKNLLSK